MQVPRAWWMRRCAALSCEVRARLFEHPYTQQLLLLKNDLAAGAGAPLLPLTGNTKVALIGPLADDQRDLLGAWTFTGDPKCVTALRQALSERLGKRLLYAKGCSLSQVRMRGP